MIKKWFLGLSLGTSLLVLSACGGADESAENENAQPETQEQAPSGEENAAQPEMPEPDLEDIPEVVAQVNGEEVSKEEFETAYTGQFQQAAMQAQMSGQEIDQTLLKNQLAESMVGQKLLIQEAENQKLTASDEEVDQTLEQLAQQNGLETTDEFLKALDEQGMKEEQVRSQVATQVKVDQLIAESAGDTTPSNEEVEAAYEQIKEQQEQMGSEEELPAFEELKPELEEQVKTQKENEATQTLVAELREKADVTINL
ncbi:SurA N-terminal domain-containing protein [Planococcus maritimus]|uniref:peptidylprolyl isomerase n=1 Tax=Planococcus maritimus TaxID=192421 RepID=A0A7D7MGE6_PLAMR|nr:SurA N-terminal domain-containing protein [Planococcus maritimus]OED33495.1 peptidylprolyl isomerase [Planococcus maritimus]QMT17131.1 SurA N-terminal domain-containing protein [Planococcus maritimus]